MIRFAHITKNFCRDVIRFTHGAKKSYREVKRRLGELLEDHLHEHRKYGRLRGPDEPRSL